MKKVYFYNTLHRKKEEFKSIKRGKVGIYSCGPTVYWNQHIGNMYAFTIWDVLVRFLRYVGFKVTWVMNITDVGHNTDDAEGGEDKMEKGAKRENMSVWQVAKKYEKQFLDSLDLLNINRPDVLCRATEHIEEQINLARKIDDNGFAYKTKTGLVFDTGKFSEYADFANLKLEEMDVGARVEVDWEKKKPWDFLLWVTNQPEHIMKWKSPWGEGFPGWHLECTAMSTKYLGETFDIHTGGIEHIGVHHTNEIAQGYGAFGHQTANFWLHNAWLTLKEGKMSKSLGNVYTVADLVEMGFDPMAFRYLVMTSNYRKGLVFSKESVKSANIAWNKLKKVVTSWPKGGTINKSYQEEFISKLSDDLGVAEALAIVWKLVKDKEIKEADKKATILDFDRVLGLKLNVQKTISSINSILREVEELAKIRQEARNKKDFRESDRLRDEISQKGYCVEDINKGEYRIVKKIGM